MPHTSQDTCSTVFKSPLGWFGVVWCDAAVRRVSFGYKTRRAVLEVLGDVSKSVRVEDCPDAGLVEQLREYAAGEAVDCSGVVVETAHLTPFGRRIVQACRAIPYGRTATYGDLAAKAGSSGAARAVGQCMAANRVPLIVPCHRVVGVGGRLGGFSAPGGVAVKRLLLSLEQASE